MSSCSRGTNRAMKAPDSQSLGIEIGLGQDARRAALPLVVRLDERDHPHRLIEVAEAEQSLGIWQEPAWSGVLNNRRLAAGEIANCPIAYPRILQLHAGRLGAT